jgi:alkylhydroperoxidase family enzyme
MARLPYLTREELPEADRDIWDKFVQARGSEPGHVHRIVANAPNLLRRFLGLADELRNGTELDPKLRELALMTVGRIAKADYEFLHHWNISLRVGVKREQLEQLADFEHAAVFNDQERAVMRYAAEVTTNVNVGDATFNSLRGFLDNRRLLELTMNVAFYNAVVRILVPLGVELEADAKKG